MVGALRANIEQTNCVTKLRLFCSKQYSPNVLVKRRVRSTRPVEAAGRNALERFVICLTH